MKTVFIDGQVGTTGLQIKEKLTARSDIKLVEIDHEFRKDASRKKEIINSVDLTILCLPDGPSKESALLLDNDSSRIIDASTAHRTNPDWVYGFAELEKGHREKIVNSRFTANPGCHATGFIAAVNPLIQNGIMGRDYPFTATSITGFSGGGKQLIEKYKNSDKSEGKYGARPYGLSLTHKHLPEMQSVIGLDMAPQFYPIVGDFERGMLVSIPLFTHLLNRKVTPKDVRDILDEHYNGEKFIRVMDLGNEEDLDGGFLNAIDCNDTNRLDISVFGHDKQITIISRLDNLGKGASGAAIQNMNLMLGFEEDTGLLY